MQETYKSEIEQLREELYDCIDRFGIDDKRTVEKSQELDKALNVLSLVS